MHHLLLLAKFGHKRQTRDFFVSTVPADEQKKSAKGFGKKFHFLQLDSEASTQQQTNKNKNTSTTNQTKATAATVSIDMLGWNSFLKSF